MSVAQPLLSPLFKYTAPLGRR